MQPTLIEVIEWVKQAGEILRAGYGKRHTITLKGRVDLVTEVDAQSEALLLSLLRGKYPDHTIYAEESGEINGGNGHTWYIDPVDGTTNYAHGLPFFCISIAYAEHGKLRLGVVYDPITDECFSAEAGKGAWLNGEPIHVSGTEELISSLLVTGFPYNIATTQNTNLNYFARFANLTQGVRRLGSAALDLCYVACGRIDGYWEMGLKPWDMTAGALINQEAGAKVTTMTGDENFLRPPYDLIVANPTLHSRMLQTIRETP